MNRPIQSVAFVSVNFSNVRTITHLRPNHPSIYLCPFLFVRFGRLSTEFVLQFSNHFVKKVSVPVFIY